MNEINLQIPRQAATLRLLVEDKIRSAIAAGHFKPGQRLIERELCEQIGVGRTSVREALRQLEAEGLVVTVPHRGPEVSSISPDEARQLYELRALLEGFAGRNFARNGSDAAIAELGRAVDGFATAAQGSDRAALVAAKTRFYAVLTQGAGNVFVTQTLTTLHNRITLLRVTSMTQAGRLDDSVAEIREIYDAIVARDPERAEALCRNHIAKAAEVAMAVLARQGSGAPE
ncbi:GntR family transcriptional regulator [Bradyrhizobium sp. U87765 SZCCT0131]|uniref:GntR family transcriptional regulator n=1 Tax=unclassified Bradyrhizobium TaxID=2631580 RepID=UPI001BABF771|nr:MULTISPECIES: GntR family transcriptional regulator [unclassified Bradyrhizobium]MBR1220397.1 GntR family transcriptional regulator [Bradyrhizobium sp. U87765 SZCCT0131]MBR1263148.1 GntR family transcriptional regulator [Bradyrhizobium sp. U87765 SZCCT0134]MBR1306969.1 GntR family transcriptional regulator [Bradyrhizobium sp. U87765 SZCCT0110]MBR1323468.1 GntR family transcriptional regulator [Bradyrhizobium sp. U87765 SZCCT0109]MBR1345923.1 GntR family transcriptional regulator [Bradyrhizo